MPRLNKKILCFVDEYGAAGEKGFALGAVLVWAHRCGQVDKAFSDLLPATVNEVHSANWRGSALQDLLGRFVGQGASKGLILLNRQTDVIGAARPAIYANALIETVKIGVRRFGQEHRISASIRNVDVIVDLNGQNIHPDFERAIAAAQLNDGLFRAVNRVVALDSAASRVLQLADVVAHSRAWLARRSKCGQSAREFRSGCSIRKNRPMGAVFQVRLATSPFGGRVTAVLARHADWQVTSSFLLGVI